MDYIRIGPFGYTVSHEAVQTIRDDGRDLIGQIDYLNLTMRLAEKNAPEVVFAAQWHEVLHAIDNMMGLGLTEKQVDRLSHAVVMVLRDNPELAEVPGRGMAEDELAIDRARVRRWLRKQ